MKEYEVGIPIVDFAAGSSFASSHPWAAAMLFLLLVVMAALFGIAVRKYGQRRWVMAAIYFALAIPVTVAVLQPNKSFVQQVVDGVIQAQGNLNVGNSGPYAPSGRTQ
ncbi:hypothetical protein L4Z64_001170 [Pseudomonas aeruginosa]|nr:hypothetical protein [Pseudomonas aeruginosa]